MEACSQESTSGSIYNLIPFDSIRELMHMLRADESVDKISPELSRQNRIQILSVHEGSRASHVLYRNHYSVNSSDIYDCVE